jgi:hypothetical protein
MINKENIYCGARIDFYGHGERKKGMQTKNKKGVFSLAATSRILTSRIKKEKDRAKERGTKIQ